MNKPKVKVGDKLWLVERKLYTNSMNPREVTVTKVGRIYFTCTSTHHEARFYIENLRQDPTTGTRYKLYPNKQVHDDELEFDSLLEEIKLLLTGYGNLKRISLNQLQEIKRILGESSDTK